MYLKRKADSIGVGFFFTFFIQGTVFIDADGLIELHWTGGQNQQIKIIDYILTLAGK